MNYLQRKLPDALLEKCALVFFVEEKFSRNEICGAKESTQNILFLFIFNKLNFLSRFVHVLYKNGRQKAVFT